MLDLQIWKAVFDHIFRSDSFVLFFDYKIKCFSFCFIRGFFLLFFYLRGFFGILWVKNGQKRLVLI